MQGRFSLVHTKARERKAREAGKRLEAHERTCRNCKAEKPCADKSALEIERAMHEAKPTPQ